MEEILAKDIMSKKPITTTPTDTVADAIQSMLKHNVSGLPVLQGDELVGIITEGDVMEKIAAEAKNPSAVRVENIMTKDPITGTQTMVDTEVAATLEKNKIKKLPIVDGKQLIGILTQTDLVHALATKWV